MTTPPPAPKPTPPPFLELARYTKDNMPLGPWESFRKVGATEMVRLSGPFAVETISGTVICQDGWLARDTAGYPYPITVDEQANTYEPDIGIPEDDEDLG